MIYISGEKVAILGATGFIGSYVTKLFKRKCIDIIACSKNGGVIDGIAVDKVDLTKDRELFTWLYDKNVTTVIYLSSEIPLSFRESNWDSNWKLFNNNTIMHKNVFECWNKYKFHLIYASSCSVYGTSYKLVTEGTMPIPDNLYSISKLVGENLFNIGNKNGLTLTILRISAPYGYNPRIPTVFNIFFENALNNADLTLFNNGSRQQNFIYVKDVAHAFFIAYEKMINGTFNIASNKTISMIELANTIVNLIGSHSKIINSKYDDQQKDFSMIIDISKAKYGLGFVTEFSIEQGIMNIINGDINEI